MVTGDFSGAHATSGDGDDAYFRRDFCLRELTWAFAAKKHVQPVVHLKDKENIGLFVGMAPGELKAIGNIDFVDLNTSNSKYWNVGVDEIVDKANKAGAFATAGSARRTSYKSHRSDRSLRSVVPMPETTDDGSVGPPAPAAGPDKDDVMPFDDAKALAVVP